MTKKFTFSISLFLAFVMTLVISMQSLAATYWQLEVSTPATVLQSSTFNLDYSILASETNEPFTVELIANGVTVETQNISTGDKYGYNGRFTKTNVPEGTYTYFVKATSTTDSTTQQSGARTLTVNLPDTQTVVISSDGENVTTARATRNTTASGAEVAAVTSTTTPTEEIVGITETSSTEAATNVAAATSNNTRNFAFAGLALLVLVGAVLWYGISKYLDKNET